MARRRRRILRQQPAEKKAERKGRSMNPRKLPPNVQNKLTIGNPNDRFEQEADTVADKVVASPSGAKSPTSTAGEGIQRSLADGITPIAQRMPEEKPQAKVQKMEEEPQAKAEVQRSEEKEPQAKAEVQRSEEKEPQAKGDVQMMEEEPQAKADVQRMEEEPQAKAEVQRSEEKEPQAKADVQLMEEEPQAKADVQKMEEEPQAKAEVQRSEEKEPQAKADVQLMEEEPQAKADVQKMEEEPQAKAEVQRSEEKEPQAKADVQMMEEEPQAKADVQKMEEEPQAKAEVQRSEEKEPQAKSEVQLAEEKEPQAKSQTATASVAPTNISERINAARGSGDKMDPKTRAFMEDRFGADFSDVNIHTDKEASELTSDMKAQAFATGKDVFFNTGKYNPETNEGKRLLAHELTHTIQQSGKKAKSDKKASNAGKGDAQGSKASKPKVKENAKSGQIQMTESDEEPQFFHSRIEIEIKKDYGWQTFGIYMADNVPDSIGFKLPKKYQALAHEGRYYYFNPASKKLTLFKMNPAKKEEEEKKEAPKKEETNDGFPAELSSIPLSGSELKRRKGVVIDGMEGIAIIYSDGSVELWDSSESKLQATFVPSPLNLLGHIPGIPKDFFRYMTYDGSGHKKGMTGFNPDAIFAD